MLGKWARRRRAPPPVSSCSAVAVTRYRCAACGNLTRFTVTSTRRSRAFHHFSLAGELKVEDEEVLAERVEDVMCRWCGTSASVEVLGERGA